MRYYWQLYTEICIPTYMYIYIYTPYYTLILYNTPTNWTSVEASRLGHGDHRGDGRAEATAKPQCLNPKQNMAYQYHTKNNPIYVNMIWEYEYVYKYMIWENVAKIWLGIWVNMIPVQNQPNPNWGSIGKLSSIWYGSAQHWGLQGTTDQQTPKLPFVWGEETIISQHILCI